MQPETANVQVPGVSENTVRELMEKLYGLETKSITKLNSYDDQNFHVKAADPVNNSHIKEIWSLGYVLKILNVLETNAPGLVSNCTTLTV